MELLERYLDAVKKYLPWQGQDDLVAELHANLEAQLEDKEAALGRSLTEDEAAEWIRQLGDPRQMAFRYWPQRSLIGPALFPSYMLVLRWVSFWLLILMAAGAAVRLVLSDFSLLALAGVPMNLAVVMLINLVIVTGIFACIEIVGRRRSASKQNRPAWKPGVLFRKAPVWGRGVRPRHLSQAIAETVLEFFFLIWLLLIPRHPFLLLGPAVVWLPVLPYRLAPVWWPFFWSMVAVGILKLIWQVVDLARGSWQGPRTIEKIVTAAFSMIPVVVLLSIHDRLWVVLKNPAADSVRYGASLLAINQMIYVSLVVSVLVMVVSLAARIAHLWLAHKRGRVVAMQ